MEITATQKFIKMSPKKVREVAHMLKGLSPARATEVLPRVEKKAAGALAKVIKTALANAVVLGLAQESLEFSHISVGEGPRLKRFRAGSRGRAKPYKRRMSHIKVILTTKSEKKGKSGTKN